MHSNDLYKLFHLYSSPENETFYYFVKATIKISSSKLGYFIVLVKG